MKAELYKYSTRKDARAMMYLSVKKTYFKLYLQIFYDA